MGHETRRTLTPMGELVKYFSPQATEFAKLERSPRRRRDSLMLLFFAIRIERLVVQILLEN